MKKYLAELFGTFVLVFFGCGTAVVAGGFSGGLDTGFLGVVGIALAFGLAIVAAAYSVGQISGAHVNPVVSLAVLINRKMSVTDFAGYVVAQVIGAFVAIGVLAIIVANSTDLGAAGYGANGFGSLSAVGTNVVGAFVVEVVLTFVFVMAVLGVTSSTLIPQLAGFVIGLVLTLVHLAGISLTGTSVNPARSLAPAVFTGGEALSQVWLFILAPLVGAALAAFAFRAFYPGDE